MPGAVSADPRTHSYWAETSVALAKCQAGLRGVFPGATAQD